jgi:hypothetical protein
MSHLSSRFAVALGLCLGLLAAPAVLAQESACAAPGVTLLTDPEGDWSGTVGGVGTPEQDLLSLHLAQTPSGDGDLLLHFTIKVQPFAFDPLPNAAWYSSFENPDATIFGVRMQTDGSGAATYYSYLAGPNNAGGIDGRFVTSGSEVPGEPGSGHSLDGTITIVTKAQSIGIFPPYAGQLVGPFNAATIQAVSLPNGGGAAFTMDEMPAGLSRDGFFVLQNPAQCKPDGHKAAAHSGSGVLFGGSLGLTLLLGLGLAALRRRTIA